MRAQAYGLGFDLVGIATLGPMDTAAHFERWLDAGLAAGMKYMERGRTTRLDSRLPFPGARSAIVAAMNYGGTQPGGSFARYARGRDYHRVIEKKLRALLKWIRDNCDGPVAGKPYVDTGPLLERDLARCAGIGWFGKNTNLINPRIGSFFFIGTLVVDLYLDPDTPFEEDRCSTCRRCLDACPTGALVDERVLDANRCISYLTIENRGPIPTTLRVPVGDLVYGCDICQDVCPWNVRFAHDSDEPELQPHEHIANPDLGGLLGLSDAEFSIQFLGTAVTRARREGLARNIAIALGNRRAAGDGNALARALADDPSPMVRAASAWALGQFDDSASTTALMLALDRESDASVLDEVRSALASRTRDGSGA